MFVLLPFFAIAAIWVIERAVERLQRQSWLPKRAGTALRPHLSSSLLPSRRLGLSTCGTLRETGQRAGT